MPFLEEKNNYGKQNNTISNKPIFFLISKQNMQSNMKHKHCQDKRCSITCNIKVIYWE